MHYPTAISEGSLVAYNMMNKWIPNQEIPMFWTKQHGKNMFFTGNGKFWDKTIIEGNPEDQEFISWHIKDGIIQAATSMGSRNKDALLFNTAMRLNIHIK